MEVLRRALSKALSVFVEPLKIGALELSLFGGATLRDLTIKPSYINSFIEENDVEFRLESGHIDEMTISYSVIPSLVTIHVHSMSLKARPNVVAQLTKQLVKTLDQMMSENESESVGDDLSVAYMPGQTNMNSRIVPEPCLSPLLQARPTSGRIADRKPNNPFPRSRIARRMLTLLTSARPTKTSRDLDIVKRRLTQRGAHSPGQLFCGRGPRSLQARFRDRPGPTACHLWPIRGLSAVHAHLRLTRIPALSS
eukprot:Selendium_serpulae@DN5295_c0_g1_i4.p1